MIVVDAPCIVRILATSDEFATTVKSFLRGKAGRTDPNRLRPRRSDHPGAGRRSAANSFLTCVTVRLFLVEAVTAAMS
jgi:hypothetical protein